MMAPLAPTSSSCSPTSYHSGWTGMAHPYCALAPTAHQETGFSSPRHTMKCTTAYCFSARMIRGTPKEQWSLGSLALVHLSDPYPVQQLTSVSLQEKLPSSSSCSCGWSQLIRLYSCVTPLISTFSTMAKCTFG